MRSKSWLTLFHFGVYDEFGNFWHFRQIGKKQLFQPITTYGRIEATLSKKMDQKLNTIYNKRILFTFQK